MNLKGNCCKNKMIWKVYMQTVIFKELICYKLYLQGIYAKTPKVINKWLKKNILKEIKTKMNKILLSIKGIFEDMKLWPIWRKWEKKS